MALVMMLTAVLTGPSEPCRALKFVEEKKEIPRIRVNLKKGSHLLDVKITEL